MTKQVVIGNNVVASITGTVLNIAIDLAVDYGQTKGSQKPGKLPNVMVGTTKTYTAIPGSPDGARIMVHCIKPMSVQESKKAKALRELDDEDNDYAVNRAASAHADAVEGLNSKQVAQLLAMLKG